jgi:hypothetical protein
MSGALGPAWTWLAFSVFSIALSMAYASPGSYVGSQNYTVAYANSTINSTANYIETINQSGYLLFYPNLSKAYSYLEKARSIYTKSPSAAVAYANQAEASAREQYATIGQYRLYSLVAAAIFTIAMGAILYLFMIPVRKTVKKSSSTTPARISQKKPTRKKTKGHYA